ncbi:MAG: pyridoxal-phosphate dependent enzyme, partial [Gaiellaceae bacterium]
LELAERGTHVLVNSLNPYRLEGQKTAAFELADELGGPPDLLALPYGGGGNTCAYALGFEELGAGPPRIVAAEAVDRDATVASAIRIAEPAHRKRAEEAVSRSGGEVVSLSDEAILAAWQRLAQEEGVFCEPSSAAGVAALEQIGVEAGATVVCVITGHGLKDPEAVERSAPPVVEVDADPDAIAEAAER